MTQRGCVQSVHQIAELNFQEDLRNWDTLSQGMVELSQSEGRGMGHAPEIIFVVDEIVIRDRMSVNFATVAYSPAKVRWVP